MHPIIYYFGIGLIWTAFIEFLTTHHAENYPEEVPQWTNRERLVQLGLWPLFLVVFITKLFKP